MTAYLSGQAKFSVSWFNVLGHIPNDHLLVQPYLVICSGLRDQMFADGLRKPEGLGVWSWMC